MILNLYTATKEVINTQSFKRSTICFIQNTTFKLLIKKNEYLRSKDVHVIKSSTNT